MISRGIKKEFATVMMVLYLTTKLGMANHVTNTAEALLKRKPKTIEDFIKDYVEVWRWVRFMEKQVTPKGISVIMLTKGKEEN